jgi:hypothetical protein
MPRVKGGSLSAKPAGCDMRRSAEGAANHRARASSLRSSARYTKRSRRSCADRGGDERRGIVGASVNAARSLTTEHTPTARQRLMLAVDRSHRRVGHGRARRRGRRLRLLNRERLVTVVADMDFRQERIDAPRGVLCSTGRTRPRGVGDSLHWGMDGLQDKAPGLPRKAET